MSQKISLSVRDVAFAVAYSGYTLAKPLDGTLFASRKLSVICVYCGEPASKEIKDLMSGIGCATCASMERRQALSAEQVVTAMANIGYAIAEPLFDGTLFATRKISVICLYCGESTSKEIGDLMLGQGCASCRRRDRR